MPLKILQLFLLLFVCILVHELGHLCLMRHFGVRVKTFSVFFSPGFRIFSTRQKWFTRLFPRFAEENRTDDDSLFNIEYVLGWLPFGGFVMPEIPSDASDKSIKWNILNIPAWQRCLINIAGVVMNLVMALVCCCLLCYHYYDPDLDNKAYEREYYIDNETLYSNGYCGIVYPDTIYRMGLLPKHNCIIIKADGDSLDYREDVSEKIINAKEWTCLYDDEVKRVKVPSDFPSLIRRYCKSHKCRPYEFWSMTAVMNWDDMILMAFIEDKGNIRINRNSAFCRSYLKEHVGDTVYIGCYTRTGERGVYRFVPTRQDIDDMATYPSQSFGIRIRHASMSTCILRSFDQIAYESGLLALANAYYLVGKDYNSVKEVKCPLVKVSGANNPETGDYTKSHRHTEESGTGDDEAEAEDEPSFGGYGYILSSMPNGFDASYILRMLLLLNITFFVFNLLPIPPLDGGHFWFNAYEMVVHKPVPVVVRNILSIIGALYLMIPFFWDIIKDIFTTIGLTTSCIIGALLLIYIIYSLTFRKRRIVRSLEKQAVQGAAEAQFSLAVRYHEGMDVEKDINKCVYWMFKAANQEYAPAQYFLAILFGTGEGVEQDEYKAYCLVRSSAEHGYPKAMYMLGICYRDGLGTDVNIDLARYWLHEAADSGEEEAHKALDDMNG